MLVLTHRPRIFGLGSSFLTLYPWLLGLGWFGLSGLVFLALAFLVLAPILVLVLISAPFLADCLALCRFFGLGCQTLAPLVLVPSVAFVAEMAVLLG